MKKVIALLLLVFAFTGLQSSFAKTTKTITTIATSKTAFALPMPGMDEAKKVVSYAKSHSGATQQGYKGNKVFENREGRLPAKDDKDHAITYKEYDVNKFVKGQNRGAERVVIGYIGTKFYKAYYTDDHYSSFKEIK